MMTRYRVLLVLPVFAFAVFPLAAGGRSEPACGDDGYCGQITTYVLPTAAAWLDDDRMYVAYYGGTIELIDVESGKRIKVLEGLSIPQGLTVLDGRLYVTDMGGVCHRMLEDETVSQGRCRRDDFKAWPDRKRVEFLRATGARILSYRIDSTGGLSDQRVIEDRILSWDRDHSANGLTNDGEYVYVSIGHPDYNGAGYFTENAQRFHGRDDLMGTIGRFRPADEEPRVEVYASGLRNVYGISIAPDGTIYGADNNGPPEEFRHKEELNAIVEGGYYGYPSFGTNQATSEHGVTEPVAVLPGAGSTVAYAAADGVYVAYLHHTGPVVVDRFDYDTFTPERFFSQPRTFITSILERGDRLYLLAMRERKIHIVERRAGSVLGRMPIPNWAATWAMDSAAIRRTYREAVAGEPAAGSTFDVYLDGSRLVYVKEPCQAADMREQFFLRVYPSQGPSESVNVVFLDQGVVLDGICVAAATLPDYRIARVRTGQFRQADGLWEALWEVELSGNLNGRRVDGAGGQ